MKKFPFRVTLSLWLVLITTIWNILTAHTAFEWMQTLREFSAQPDPALLLVGGVFWSLAGCLLLWNIWQGTARAWILFLGGGAGYSLWYWGGRFLWQEPRPNWLFAVILNLVVLVFIIFTKNSMTREAYERKSQHPEVK